MILAAGSASAKSKPRAVALPVVPVPAPYAGLSPGLLAPTRNTFPNLEVETRDAGLVIKVNDQFELRGDLARTYDHMLQVKLKEVGVPLVPLAPSSSPAWETKLATEGQYVLQPTIEEIVVEEGTDEDRGKVRFNMLAKYRLHAPGEREPFTTFQTGPHYWTTTKKQLEKTIETALWATADYAARCLEGKDYSKASGPNCTWVADAVAAHQRQSFGKFDARWKALDAAGDHAGALLLLADAYRRRTSQLQTDLIFERILATLKKLPARPPSSEDARRAAVQAQSAVTEKRYDDAIRLFSDAIGFSPWWPDGFYNIALILSERGEYANAIVFMKRFVQLMPGTPEARKAQDKIYEWEGKLKT